jgi:UDP-N-acetylglucosamine 4,6-dehydratase
MHSVLITGGTGFLGRGLVRRLLDDGARRVRVYSRNEFAQSRMRDDYADERLGFFIGDVRDADRLERAMHGCDLVIHAAALKRIEVGHYNPDEMVKTNVMGSMNVIEAARRARVRRAIFISTDKAYQPISPYGTSKAMAEGLFLAGNRQTLGPRYVVCRYGNVAGSTGSVIPHWRTLLERGFDIPVTDPGCTRFWMRRSQAVDLVMKAAASEEELLIPTLPAYDLSTLALALGVSAMRIVGLGVWEKKHESMGPGNSSDVARRMSLEELQAELEVLDAEPKYVSA